MPKSKILQCITYYCMRAAGGAVPTLPGTSLNLTRPDVTPASRLRRRGGGADAAHYPAPDSAPQLHSSTASRIPAAIEPSRRFYSRRRHLLGTLVLKDHNRQAVWLTRSLKLPVSFMIFVDHHHYMST